MTMKFFEESVRFDDVKEGNWHLLFKIAVEEELRSFNFNLGRLDYYFKNVESGLFDLAVQKLYVLLFPLYKFQDVVSEIVKPLPQHGWNLAPTSCDADPFDPEILSIYTAATAFSAMDRGQLKIFISLPLIRELNCVSRLY